MRNSIGVRIPAGAPKNIPSPFGGGIFFPAAPGESKFIPVRGNPRWSTKKYSLAFWRGNFFPAAPGESKFIPDRGNPRWSTKKSPRLLAGRFFLAAPGESKFIPGRGNSRWSTKNLSSQKDGLSTAPVIKLNKQSKKSNTGK